MPTDTHPYAVMFSEEGSMQCCSFMAERRESFVTWITSLPNELKIHKLLLDGKSCEDTYATIGCLKKHLVAMKKQYEERDDGQLMLAI